MVQNTWYFLNSGKQDAYYNMALDELLMEKVRDGLNPVLRFYEWETPTLSLGYFQKAKKEINLTKVNDYGYQLVRRKTGGRAVLHDKELTYSVIIPEEYPNMPSSVTESYRVISEGLLLGFKELGLSAYFNVPKTDEDKKSLKTIRSSNCFDTPSWYELVVEGKKVAGSAQTRNDGVILQHGSILLNIDVDHLFDMFNYTNERFKEKMKNDFKNRAVAINDISNKQFTVDHLKVAFKTGFSKGLNVNLQPLNLNNEDKERLNLLIEKYKSEDWTFKK